MLCFLSYDIFIWYGPFHVHFYYAGNWNLFDNILQWFENTYIRARERVFLINDLQKSFTQMHSQFSNISGTKYLSSLYQQTFNTLWKTPTICSFINALRAFIWNNIFKIFMTWLCVHITFSYFEMLLCWANSINLGTLLSIGSLKLRCFTITALRILPTDILLTALCMLDRQRSFLLNACSWSHGERTLRLFQPRPSSRLQYFSYRVWYASASMESIWSFQSRFRNKCRNQETSELLLGSTSRFWSVVDWFPQHLQENYSYSISELFFPGRISWRTWPPFKKKQQVCLRMILFGITLEIFACGVVSILKW